jgi:ribonucleoside-triphosphate reductase
MDLVSNQLLDRFKIQAHKKVKNYPFLMGQGVWIDSEKLNIDDEVGKVLKNGTLSIGFIGLAETLVALIGSHHGESEIARNLGLEIIGYMREYCDRKSEETGLNFTLLATPAEGLSGRFVRIDKKKFGIIPGVTDRDYYTNSFHVPVYYNISAYDKLKIEAPYHALTNAGHISYVELDGDTAKNLEAFERIVRCMKELGIGYGSINHPVDRDPVCGYSGIINEVCPRCGRHEGEGISVEKLRSIKATTKGNAETCGYCGDVNEEHERKENPNSL